MRTKIFLDTNTLVDIAVERQGAAASQVVLSLVKRHMLEAQVSTQSLIDMSYIAHRYGTPAEKVEALIREIYRYVNIGYIDSSSIKWALEHSTGDFEDDAQYDCASSWGCDYFLTRDKAILARAEKANVMKAVTPEDFVSSMVTQETE